MNEWIGVVGASGEIGGAAVEYLLSSGYKVIGGQRRAESDFEGRENFRLHRMDLFDDSELQSFCNECGVVLNCAGPSYKIRGRVARSAENAHAAYADLSDIIITDHNIQNELKKNVVFVAGTGYLPGISGILLNTICAEFDRINLLQGFQAGRQYYTKIAFRDILMSSMSDSGMPEAYIKNGKTEHSPYGSDEKRDIPGIQEPVYLKSYIPFEILDALKKTDKIDELHWFNALTDKKMMDMMMKAYSVFAASDEKDGTEAADRLYDDLFSHMEIRKNWSELMYEVTGVKNGRNMRERYILNLSDSNRFSGLIGAKTAVHLLKNDINPGIYWCRDIIRYDSAQKLKDDFPEIDLEVLEIPADNAELISDEIESDYI